MTPHFASTSQAAQELAQNWGWSHKRRSDWPKDDELLCPECAAPLASTRAARPRTERNLVMARLMSVALTVSQVRDRSKTVTRRNGWLMLKPGDPLTLCKKTRGRTPGEPLVRITDVTVVSVRREPLSAITAEDVAAEGFPQMTPAEFVSFSAPLTRSAALVPKSPASNGATPAL
jgi:hypothetical protein